MKLQTLKEVKLVYSRPIKKGRTSKEGKFYGDIQHHRSRQVIDGESLDKQIHAYRMWFLFLKLGLELEQQKATLILKESSTSGEPFNKTSTERITKKIKVNRSKYEGWDLDQVLELSFDKWWPEHRYLFVDQVSKVLEPNDTISDDPNHLTIQIDRRRRLTDVIQDLRDMNESGDFQRQVVSKFPITERIRPITLLNRYNALVLKMDPISFLGSDKNVNEEIMESKSGYIRPTNKTMVKGGQSGSGYSSWQYSRTIFGLIAISKTELGAKGILLSVCDGYFTKHPTKDYLEDQKIVEDRRKSRKEVYREQRGKV